MYHDPVVGLDALVYYTPVVDGVDFNVFFELVVFVVVLVRWWWWSSCGSDGCFKSGYSNCCWIAIV